jgi:hypothetical protein
MFYFYLKIMHKIALLKICSELVLCKLLSSFIFYLSTTSLFIEDLFIAYLFAM